MDHVRAQATEATIEDDEEMGDVFNPSSGGAKDNNEPLPTIPILDNEPAGAAPERPEEQLAPVAMETPNVPPVPVLRRSERHRPPPDYYGTWAK